MSNRDPLPPGVDPDNEELWHEAQAEAREHRERACESELERIADDVETARSIAEVATFEWVGDAEPGCCKRAAEWNGRKLTAKEARAIWSDREHSWCDYATRGRTHPDDWDAWCRCCVVAVFEDSSPEDKPKRSKSGSGCAMLLAAAGALAWLV